MSCDRTPAELRSESGVNRVRRVPGAESVWRERRIRTECEQAPHPHPSSYLKLTCAAHEREGELACLNLWLNQLNVLGHGHV